MPIGPANIASVKPNSLKITCLDKNQGWPVQQREGITDAGTAGAILLRSPGTGVNSFFSFSIIRSPEGTFRRVAMVKEEIREFISGKS